MFPPFADSGQRHRLVPRLCLLAILLAAATPALCSPIRYDMVFIAQNGIAPVAGGFSYDSTNLADPFSDFLVAWRGTTFDFTKALNAFDGFPTGPCTATGPASFFDALTSQLGCDATTSDWTVGGRFVGAVGDTSHAMPVFTLTVCSGPFCESLSSQSSVFGFPGGALGDFRVQLTPDIQAPEVHSLGMVLLGMLLLAGLRSRYRLPSGRTINT